MAVFFGSMNHTISGRKRKAQQKRAKATSIYKELGKDSEAYRRETPEYKSADMTKANHDVLTVGTNEREKQVISSNYTIAPAYNKGAYQVISRENIKDIGK